MKSKIFKITIIAIFVAISFILTNNNSYADTIDQSSARVNVEWELAESNSEEQQNSKLFILVKKMSEGNLIGSSYIGINQGENVDILRQEEFAGFFERGYSYSIQLMDTVNVDNWNLVVNEREMGKNPYEFSINENQIIQLNIKFIVTKNNTKLIINSTNGDGDLFPKDAEWIKDNDSYNRILRIINPEYPEFYTERQIKMNETVDLLNEYGPFLVKNQKYYIGIYSDTNSDCTAQIKINGNEVENNQNYDAIYGTEIDLTDDVDLQLNVYNKIMGAKLNFEVSYFDKDGNDGLTHAPEYYNFRVNLSSSGEYGKDINYFKRIKDDNGNLTYVYVNSIAKESGAEMPEPPEGLEDYIRVNNNKHTEIIIPTATGAFWEFCGINDFQPGGQNGYTTSIGARQYGESLTCHIAYSNDYKVKTFEKVDVEGNPTDASFEISYDDQNLNKRRKFVYKHYDSRTINGTTYKNVYEVVGSTDLDDENSESIINTQDGKYTLYYPLYYLVYNNYYDNNEFFKYTSRGYARLIDKIYVVEKTVSDNFVKNTDEKIIIISDRESVETRGILQLATTSSGFEYGGDYEWNAEEVLNNFDTHTIDNETNCRIVNKKKPTIKEVLDSNGKYEGQFIFKVYEKDTKRLVATLKLKANEEACLEPLTIDENGNTTGYLENGKTYIVIEEEQEGILNTNVEGKNGILNEYEGAKSFEFTFDNSLDKIYKGIFHNELIKEEIKEEKQEPEEEVEKIEQVQTGDTIERVCIVLIIAVISCGSTFVFKKNIK